MVGVAAVHSVLRLFTGTTVTRDVNFKLDVNHLYICDPCYIWLLRIKPCPLIQRKCPNHWVFILDRSFLSA